MLLVLATLDAPLNEEETTMTTRREFLQLGAGALAGIAFVGCDLLAAAPARAQVRRREVVVNGRRVKTVDVHAHCAVPEALALMNLKLAPGSSLPPFSTRRRRHPSASARWTSKASTSRRSASIRTGTRRSATSRSRSSASRTQSSRKRAPRTPDRFVAFATVALQHPGSRRGTARGGVKKFGLRGAAIGGSVNGEAISDPKFHPFWAKAEQLGVLVFIHPQGAGVAADIPSGSRATATWAT
jgi:aminocarboxymuconate-semialdehyde decarboxylase